MKICSAAVAMALAATVAIAHEAPPSTKPSQGTHPTPKVMPFTRPPKVHSGGTDAYGCHTNSQTGEYHCHKPK